jgi:hypothetical protein
MLTLEIGAAIEAADKEFSTPDAMLYDFGPGMMAFPVGSKRGAAYQTNNFIAVWDGNSTFHARELPSGLTPESARMLVRTAFEEFDLSKRLQAMKETKNG